MTTDKGVGGGKASRAIGRRCDVTNRGLRDDIEERKRTSTIGLVSAEAITSACTFTITSATKGSGVGMGFNTSVVFHRQKMRNE